jgi:carboxylate-amine ligase
LQKLPFNRSQEPTIGVELEIQIIDPETLELKSIAPEILNMVPESLRERIKPEFIRSMVEINTGICSSVAEVEKDIRQSFDVLNEITTGAGGMLYLASLHPFSIASAQEVSDHPRYKRIMNELQFVGRRFISQGLHVHIGVDDEEKALKINNNMRIYLPVLLALTTSSPFFESVDTGLMSYRAKLFEALPLAGMPDHLGDWDDFSNLVHLLKKSNIIESVKDIWWDVRPHPDFGTVEVRICDLPSSLKDILGITALIQALVIAIEEQYENPEPHIQLLRSNKWQAARYGLDGLYVDPFFAQKYTMKEAAINLCRHVRPLAEQLDSIEYLDEVPRILDRGTSAHIQKQLYLESGGDFHTLIRKVQELFFA